MVVWLVITENKFTKTIMTLNERSKIVHKANEKWWQNIDTGERIDRNPRELLMLIISELAEAMEGRRKNLQDDKLPNRKMTEVEMADTYIRILDFSAGYGYSLTALEPEMPDTDNEAEALFRITYLVTRLHLRLENHLACSESLSIVIANIQGYCIKFGYDLMGAYDEKMAYNATRVDHTHEARKIAGGKQF